MKISYVTNYDALDIHHWSGTGFMIAKSLKEQDNELDYIGSLRSRPNAEMYLNKLYYKFLKKDFDFGREIHTARQYAAQTQARLKKNTDVVFCPGSVPISLVETKKPKVFYTDGTFAGMIGFYPYLSNLSPDTIKSGNFLERQALESCQLAIYSSDWAAQTAIEHYGADPAKLRVVPFGSNIDAKKNLEEVKSFVSLKSKSECHLLFLAVDWERKGGDLALEIAEGMNIAGLKTVLHVVGIKTPPVKSLPPFVINHGFISKSKPDGIKLIENLMVKSHFLILPTRADCTPIVFAEANSFGLPCIATEVGGIATVVRNGINGRAFSLEAGSVEYVKYIQAVFLDRKIYSDLCLSSFHEYESRLNWGVAGAKITRLMSEL